MSVEAGTICNKTNFQISSLAAALVQYRTLNGNYPSQAQGLEALVTCPRGAPQPTRWTQCVKAEGILDLWGRKMQYRYPGKHNTKSYDIYSLGPDGVESADDIGNW